MFFLKIQNAINFLPDESIYATIGRVEDNSEETNRVKSHQISPSNINQIEQSNSNSPNHVDDSIASSRAVARPKNIPTSKKLNGSENREEAEKFSLVTPNSQRQISSRSSESASTSPSNLSPSRKQNFIKFESESCEPSLSSDNKLSYQILSDLVKLNKSNRLYSNKTTGEDNGEDKYANKEAENKLVHQVLADLVTLNRTDAKNQIIRVANSNNDYSKLTSNSSNQAKQQEKQQREQQQQTKISPKRFASMKNFEIVNYKSINSDMEKRSKEHQRVRFGK